MNKDLMFSSKTDLWETPQEFFDKLNEEFHFTLDACALPENAKCKRYYTPEILLPSTASFPRIKESCLILSGQNWSAA